MKRFLALLCVFCILSPNIALAKRKKKEKLPPMVQTVDEWLEEATDVKMDMRKRPEDIKEEEKKYIPPEKRPVYIEKYNVAPGKKELDLTHIYKTNNIRSPFIADSKFNNAVYTETYYYPQTRQIASTFYLIELDPWLADKEKLENLSIFEHERFPLISTAHSALKEGYFSTLTLVDFSKSGKELLVKEKRGSNRYGIYETYVWIYYLTKESKEKSECYNNNVAFGEEMREFEAQGYSLSEEEIKADLEDLRAAPEIYSLPANDGVLEKNEKENILDSSNEVELTYDDLNDFITSVWRAPKSSSSSRYSDSKPSSSSSSYSSSSPSSRLHSSSNKTRWYNVPEDFRADIPKNIKEEKGYGVRLDLLNETIKAYWLNRSDLILNHIRWELIPLGFSSSGDEIVVKANAFEKSGKKVSLGNWAVNIKNGLPRLIPEDEEMSVESNAVYLIEKLNPR